jgi:signal transduction histidine kinase
MAHDLHLRLVLTYCGVTLAALVLLGSVFTAVLATSVSGVHVRDMRAETSSLAAQLDRAFARGARRSTIQRLIRHDSALLGKHIILLDRQGRVHYDSTRLTPFSRGTWRMADLGALRAGRWASVQVGGRFGLQYPLFVRGHEVGAVALILTAADTGFPWGQISAPLLGVLGALLVVWVIIAISLARSVSRPLRRVSAGLARARDGEFDHQVPEEGWSQARALARRYNEMMAEVARSRQAQRDFVANAAHELKTPVALVDGFARSLADGTAQRDGSERDAVEYIRTESAHLARVVEQLFALASLDADTRALTPAPCRPGDILRETAARFAHKAAARGVMIEVACEPDIPVCLWDRVRVGSALDNLIDNALEHSPQSGAITTRAFRSGDNVALTVDDSGPGIAPDELPHVFERFYRGRGRRVEGHAGLGLALVREVAERHGGSAEVSSCIGMGTRFSLTLPVEAPTESADPQDAGTDREMTA